MQASKILGVVVLLAMCEVAAAQVAAGAPSAAAAQTAPQTNQAQPATPAQPPAPMTTLPGQGVPQVPLAEGAPLRVMVGKSILVNTADKLKRVSVTDPSVADAIVVTPNQVLLHGRAPGEVTLVLWDENERSRSFDLRVDVDVTAAAEEIHRLFPGEQITVSASRSALVLAGIVSTKDVAERAGAVAAAFSSRVVNVLAFGPQGAQEILLEVKFAEVDRTALLQLGVNFLSAGGSGNIGNTTTGQFGSIGNWDINARINAPLTGEQIHVPQVDPLNVFLFRPDLNIGVAVKALQQKNILEILAEPNLIAVNGKEASFLAGGEFPFPVVQGSGNLGAVTIQFKEFGVRLKFLPTIMPSGVIHLHVAPEVSALDFSNALTISGFTVPALSTRRAETEFELQDGQSFVIAGLMDNRVTNLASKIPGIGNVPIIGNLFKSKNLTKSKTELMVLVTAHRISPSTQAPALPRMPEKPIDPAKFDKGKEGTKPGGGGQ
jgi:pilus assembly protein CpaC